jgi:HSP20 family protein
MTDQAVKERNQDVAEAQDVGVLARPRVDVLETENEVLLLADLPGVKSDAVDVRFENGELTIHGRRFAGNANKKRALTEYEPTHYHRTFRLTEDIAADRIEAEMKAGVLTVRLPKAEAAKPRRINVKGE